MVIIYLVRPIEAKDKIGILRNVCEEINNTGITEKYLLQVKDIDSIYIENGKKPQKSVNEYLKKNTQIAIGIANQKKGKGDFEKEIKLCIELAKKEKIQFKLFLSDNGYSEIEELKKNDFLEVSYRGSYKNDEELKNNLRNQIEVFFAKIKEQNHVKRSKLKSLQKSSKGNTKSPEERRSVAVLEEKQPIEKILEETEKIFGKSQPNEYEQIRLFLYASSLLYFDSLPAQTLNISEINLLYLHRKKVIGAGKEIILILRSLLGDQSNVKPGWYWLQHIKDKEILFDAVERYAMQDESEDVRMGALKFLKDNWNNKFYKLLDKLSKDTSEEILSEILLIVETKHELEAMKIVDEIAKNTNKAITSKALRSKLVILINTNIQRAINFLIEEQNDKEIIYIGESNFEKVITAANEGELKMLIKHNQEKIRIKAYNELIKRKGIDETELSKLKKNSSWEIRFFALEGLLDLGINIGIKEIGKILKEGKPLFLREKELKEEILKNKILEKLNFEDLEKIIHWYDIDGKVVYEVIGKKYFTKFQKRLMEDIKNNFRDLNKKGIERIKKTLGGSEEYIKKHIQDQYSELDVFIRANFIVAALKILQENKIPNNAEIAKKYLHYDDRSVRTEALKLLAKYGLSVDSELLAEAAILEKNKYCEIEAAIKGAIELDKERKHKIIEKFLKSKVEKVITVTLAICHQNKININHKSIKPLLKSEITNVRETALAYITNRIKNKKTLEKLLEEYYADGTYYYNVVSGLDKILFASAGTQKSYKKKLLSDLLRWIR